MTPEPSDHPPIAPFWERLLNRIDPHRAVPIGDQATQIIAGRWLAVRRLRLNLAVADLVAQTGVDAPALLVLETGLADPTVLPPVTRQLLIDVLAAAPERRVIVASMVAYALGEQSPPPAALAQIRAEIERGG